MLPVRARENTQMQNHESHQPFATQISILQRLAENIRVSGQMQLDCHDLYRGGDCVFPAEIETMMGSYVLFDERFYDPTLEDVLLDDCPPSYPPISYRADPTATAFVLGALAAKAIVAGVSGAGAVAGTALARKAMSNNNIKYSL